MIEGKNRIMIYGPKSDGIYIVEFRMADGEYGFPRRMWRQNSSVMLAQRTLGGAVTHKLGGAACLVGRGQGQSNEGDH